MPSVRTFILPTDGADPSALLANLFSTAAGTPPTLVDGDGDSLTFIIADPSDSAQRAYDARAIPDGTTATLALGNPVTGAVYAQAADFDPLPPTAARVATIQAGTSSQPAIVSITLDPAPYGGTWTVDGIALEWDAGETDFQALFPDFAIQKTGAFTWRMTGIASGAYTPTVDPTNLRIPTGLTFDLPLNIAGQFGAAALDDPGMTLQLRVAFPNAEPLTFAYGPVSVLPSLLPFVDTSTELTALDGTVLTDYFGNPFVALAA